MHQNDQATFLYYEDIHEDEMKLKIKPSTETTFSTDSLTE